MRLLVPAFASIDVLALVLSAGAFVAIFRIKRGMIVTLAACAVAGAAARTLLG